MPISYEQNLEEEIPIPIDQAEYEDEEYDRESRDLPTEMFDPQNVSPVLLNNFSQNPSQQDFRHYPNHPHSQQQMYNPKHFHQQANYQSNPHEKKQDPHYSEWVPVDPILLEELKINKKEMEQLKLIN